MRNEWSAEGGDGDIPDDFKVRLEGGRGRRRDGESETDSFFWAQIGMTVSQSSQVSTFSDVLEVEESGEREMILTVLSGC